MSGGRSQFQPMHQYVMPVFVVWNTLPWLPVGIGSFRKQFPFLHILVVDNNPSDDDSLTTVRHDDERPWLEAQDGVTVITNPSSNKSHGAAIDAAVDWCRQQQVEYLLHLEPDCLFEGVAWYQALCDALDAGAWMAGSHQKYYGPIHPTPSLWRLSKLKTGFDICPRGADEQHVRFAELFDKPWLMQAITETNLDVDFWDSNWDTGQRAWFQCAALDKATLVDESPDFTHFWNASTHSPQQRAAEHTGLQQYLLAEPEPHAFVNRPISATATMLQDQLVATLRNTGARRAIYAGFPRHANTGDLLLMDGSLTAITAAGIDVVQKLPWPELPDRDTQADVIFLHGGGNFGDLYRHEQEFRLQLCQHDSDRPIIWMPQSINYANACLAAADAELLRALQRVEIWLRDAPSFAYASEMQLPNIKLVPDGVFGIGGSLGQHDPAGRRQVIRRLDAERLPHTTDGCDWMLPGQTMLHGVTEAHDIATRLLNNCRIVVTDRLHVHLSCVISDIPNVLVADQFGKNRATYLSWTHAHPYSAFAANWNSVHATEAELVGVCGQRGPA